MSHSKKRLSVPPLLPEKLREAALMHSMQIKNSFFVLLSIIDILDMDSVGRGEIIPSELLLNSVKDLDKLMYNIEKRLEEPGSMELAPGKSRTGS
jgi:hypothetical protein